LPILMFEIKFSDTEYVKYPGKANGNNTSTKVILFGIKYCLFIRIFQAKYPDNN